jgi:hypothetical protein
MPSNDNGDERSNGNPEALSFWGDERDVMRLPDVSPEAVNARLRAFVAEFRAKQARGERGRFFESDALLCAYAQQALDHVAEAEAKLAQCKAEDERLEEAQRLDERADAWRDRGGGLQ